MNFTAIRLLFLKDLFLSRRHLFGYFVSAIASVAIASIPNPTMAFVGFILMITVAIAAGIHLIGVLLLAETTDNTRLLVMSMPVSLLDYSIGKTAVVLTTYLIPWSAMFAGTLMSTFLLPWAKDGSAVVLPMIFLFMMSTFCVQLVTAVLSESVGWTLSVMVACNVLLNLFLMKLSAIEAISAVTKSDDLVWPPVVLLIILLELFVIAIAMSVAFMIQTRKRDLI